MPTSNKDITKWSNKDLYTRIVDTFGMPHVKRRYKQEEEASKYTIPYIPEKEVMLTTGRYNTGKISTNLLDSIYNSSKRTGVPLDIALGLAGRESTLGIGRGFKEGQDVTATDLYSNWQQIQQPAPKSQVDKWNNTINKEKRGEALTENDYADRNDFLIGEQQRLEQHKAITEHPIDNALKFYQTGKYNPGDKNHSKMVEEDGKALMSDPAIQKWLKTKTETQMKCGGRRKAQLGLDIREGGVAIPIANNMFYIEGRKHAAGGVAIGPNNKNGVEVEGGEVVEMIDSKHPSVGRQFKAGGQQQTMRVFSSVPFLRGASPAELVLGGANPDAVFKAQEDFKDRNRINDDGTTYEMGGEGKAKSKRSRPVTGILPYGYTIRNLYAVENPYRKGIKGNIVKMYDSRTLGAGVDVVSGHPELYKKAKSGKMTKKQADETAVIHLRKDDNAIRSNYADVYGKAAADTLSYGPRFLVAQARYQQGNVRKAWKPIHKAMAKGDAKALKKAVLQVTPKDHAYRRKWIEDFKVYKMGGMMYEINGNVKNGLMSARPKAQYGLATKYLKKRNKTTEKVANKQKDEPKVLDIRNTAGYKIKQAAENPWIKYPVEVASYLLTGATAKGMQVGAKVTKKAINKIDDILGKPRQEYLSRNVSDKTISYTANSKNSIGNTYKATSKDLNRAKKEVQNRPTINDLAEARSTVGNVSQHTTISYNPSSQSSVSTINYFDVKNTRLPNIERFGRKQMDAKTSRELDKVYRKVVGNKEPKSGFGRIPQQTTIEYIPKGESVSAYDASAEFHKRISDILYNNLVKKYGKKGVDKAMKSEHISKYEYGGRVKAKNGKFLKYKNGIFTDPETGEQFDVDPEVFKMYGNTKESGVIPISDYTKGTFNARPQYYAEKRLPIAGSQSIAEKAGIAKSGWSYSDSSTFDYVPNINISVPTNYAKAVGDNSKKSTSSTPRGEGTQSTAGSRGTAKVESPKPATPTNPMEARYASRVQQGQAQEVTTQPAVEYNETADKNPDKHRYTRATGFKAGEAPASPGNNQKAKDDEKDKDERLIPQFKPINTGDWIGLGSNLAGHIASYFINNNLLNKYPMPTKPALFQAAKLKTTHNINPKLATSREIEQMNLAEVGRNTSSSSTSIARKQRIMNEARDARNKLYGEKENIETQLINLDRRNRQDVFNRNIAAHNDWLDKTYIAKTNKLLEKQKNMMSLINGIPSAVNHTLGVIETRRNANNAYKAIAAVNPNVDGRLLGIGDYYVGEKTKKKYDKFGNLIG